MGTATILPLHRHTALAMSVLVLNRSFVAVHVTNVRRALALLFRDAAEVVHIDQGHFSAHSIHSWRELSALESLDQAPDEDWIRGVGFVLQAPRVIRLPAATSYLGKTCDLIARTCSQETRTAANIATAINQQANYRSITLSRRAKEDRRRGIILCVHASPVMCAKAVELPVKLA